MSVRRLIEKLQNTLEHVWGIIWGMSWHVLGIIWGMSGASSGALLNVANVWFSATKIFKGRIKNDDDESGSVSEWDSGWKKTHAGKGSSSLSHHMWDLPQLPLHFSANLQRNKTSFLSIKNCVWPDLLRSGGAQGSGSFEILRGPGIRKLRDQEVPRDQDLLRSGGAQGLLWPLIRREVYGLEWPYIKRLKVIEKQMMQRNLPQCLKEYINSYSLLTI